MPNCRNARSANSVNGAMPVATRISGLARAQAFTSSFENRLRCNGRRSAKCQDSERSSRGPAEASSASNQIDLIPSLAAPRAKLPPICVPPDVPSNASFTARVDAVHLKTRLALVINICRMRGRGQPAGSHSATSECRLQPGRALGVAPARNDSAARRAHALPGLQVDEDRMQGIRQTLDVACGKGLTIDMRLNEIRHATDLRRSDDRQPGAHCFVDGQAPGFIFRGQHEHIRCAVDLRQSALVREAMEMDVVEMEASRQVDQLRSSFRLIRPSRHESGFLDPSGDGRRAEDHRDACGPAVLPHRGRSDHRRRRPAWREPSCVAVPTNREPSVKRALSTA